MCLKYLLKTLKYDSRNFGAPFLNYLPKNIFILHFRGERLWILMQ